jgi:hypothetical protein
LRAFPVIRVTTTAAHIADKMEDDLLMFWQLTISSPATSILTLPDLLKRRLASSPLLRLGAQK